VPIQRCELLAARAGAAGADASGAGAAAEWPALRDAKVARSCLDATPVICLIALLPLPAAAMPPNAGGDPIRAEELRDHVAFLADDRLEGRMTGEPGCELAAAWLAERFAALRLEPLGDLDADGRRTYLQHFVAVSGRALLPETSCDLAGAPLALGEDFTAVFGMGSAAGAGELVLAGFGLVATEPPRDDFAGLDVAGRMVVVFSGAPGRDRGEGDWLDTKPGGAAARTRAKIDAAFARKAAGVIVLQHRREEKERADTLPEWNSDRGDGLSCAAVQLTESAGKALFGMQQLDFDALLDAADRGDPVGRPLPGVTGEVKLVTRPIERPTANVVALLRGEAAADGAAGPLALDHVVIGAHYDHLGRGGSSSLAGGTREIHNGADDNASGTAALVELAEQFSTGPRPARSLVFAAWSGEELGLLGSQHWTRAPALPLERCFANLNLDMVGRAKGKSCVIGAIGSSPAFAGLPARVNGELALGLALELSDGGMTQGSSDHQSFLNAQVPALFFFSGLHEDYHKPSDDADRLNYEGAAAIASLCGGVARALLSLDAKPAFTAPASANPHAAGGPGAPGGTRPRGGNRPWFGSIPAFGGGVSGVVFDGVSPGSPAEKAGIRKGDQLIEWNGRAVASLEDFTALLGASKVGDLIKVVLLRDGKKVEAELTLALRPQG
jgi:hypothetical protein